MRYLGQRVEQHLRPFSNGASPPICMPGVTCSASQRSYRARLGSGKSRYSHCDAHSRKATCASCWSSSSDAIAATPLAHTYKRRDRTPDLIAICMDLGQPNSLNPYGSGSDHGTCTQIKKSFKYNDLLIFRALTLCALNPHTLPYVLPIETAS